MGGGKQYYKWKELFLANLTHCFLLIYIFNLKNADFSEIFACSRNVMIPGYHRLSSQYQYQQNYLTLNTQYQSAKTNKKCNNNKDFIENLFQFSDMVWADDLFKFLTLYFVDRSQTEMLGWLQVAY